MPNETAWPMMAAMQSRKRRQHDNDSGKRIAERRGAGRELFVNPVKGRLNPLDIALAQRAAKCAALAADDLKLAADRPW